MNFFLLTAPSSGVILKHAEFAFTSSLMNIFLLTAPPGGAILKHAEFVLLVL